MDPFRAPRPTGRGAVTRSEPTSRQQADEPQPIREVPVVAPQAPSQHSYKKEKSSKRIPLIIIGIVLALAVIVGGWFAWSSLQRSDMSIDESKYQAVFFTNGQVYFGKLKMVGGDYLKLSDVYYLQAQSDEEGESSNPQATANSQSNVQLIKLGDEIHGPEDQMMISRDQVLFYENLKTDGKVAQSIEQHKKP